MEFIKTALGFFLHLDEYLATIISVYGTWTYIILFIVIFVETGLVIMPFLPGDSLLFAAGSFAALGSLNIWVLVVSLSIAAVLGDAVNYTIGHYLGERAYDIKWIKGALENMHSLRSMAAGISLRGLFPLSTRSPRSWRALANVL
jgi:membrane-associated protein